jgi:ribonuclease-3
MTGLPRLSTDNSGIAALEEALGHRFRDPALLMRALTHSSMGPERSNERLEFLGDRVLGLAIAERLYADFPHEAEGGLAVRLNTLVRRDACARAAELVGLGDHIVMASSEHASGGRKKAALLAGACEAVIAALYLDGGYEAARRFVLRYWDEAFASFAPELRDAKSALQEWSQGPGGPRAIPNYRIVSRDGPDHAPRFRVEVRVGKVDPQMGEGPSKRDAEQDAAQKLLARIGVWKE